jgi:hypothetical protein
MGKPAPSLPDQAYQVVEAVLDSAGDTTPWGAFTGSFNFQLTGTFSGTVVIDVSYDGGATSAPVMVGADVISFTTAGSTRLENHELGVLFRARMSAFTSGSALARLSQ